RNYTGSGNTALGYSSGAQNGVIANTSGSFNTFIGYLAGPTTATQLDNATAIGANATVSVSNAMVLGDSAVSVGIGTSSPAYKLDVAGTIRSSTGGFKFPDGTTQTTAASSVTILRFRNRTGLFSEQLLVPLQAGMYRVTGYV